MLQWLQSLAVLAVLSGAAALASIALNVSFLLVFVCVCLSTAAGFLSIAAVGRQRTGLEQASNAVGNFMRGQWQARILPDSADDEFSRFQHRINNLLDVVDLHLRQHEAAIDAATHADYIEKLRCTVLYDALAKRPSTEADGALAPRSASESVGALLQQLGHNVANLFEPETKEEPAAEPSDDEQMALQDEAEQDEAFLAYERVSEQRHRALQQLQHGLQRISAANAQLAQRAMHPPTPAEKSSRVSSAQIEQGMQRVAEQATVMALNVAIESARAPEGSSLHELSGELHLMAAQLQKLRGQTSALVASVVPVAEPTTSVPLSYAVEALANAEYSLREAVEQLGGDDEIEGPNPAMEQAA
jgi:hypothetical protein